MPFWVQEMHFPLSPLTLLCAKNQINICYSYSIGLYQKLNACISAFAPHAEVHGTAQGGFPGQNPLCGHHAWQTLGAFPLVCFQPSHPTSTRSYSCSFAPGAHSYGQNCFLQMPFLNAHTSPEIAQVIEVVTWGLPAGTHSRDAAAAKGGHGQRCVPQAPFCEPTLAAASQQSGAGAARSPVGTKLLERGLPSDRDALGTSSLQRKAIREQSPCRNAPRAAEA